jgi:hypothetical protein
MQLNSTSISRPAFPALAVVVASYLAGAVPTHEDVSTTRRQPYEMFQLTGGTALLASQMRQPSGISLFSVDVVAEKSVIRDTTEQEHVIARIRDWGGLSANWDGQNALAPIRQSLEAASDLVCLLMPRQSVPEPMLHATGRAGLLWATANGGYGELEFLKDGQVAYLFTDQAGKHKGIDKFDGRVIPVAISALIPVVDAI